MPTYAAPGVYVEVVKVAPPIQPVGSSTAGFIGMVTGDVDMPDLPAPVTVAGVVKTKYDLADAGTPVLLTSFNQFVTKFGNVQGATPMAATPVKDNRILAQAVYGFFQNGGTRCYVARSAAALDKAAIDAILKKFEAVNDISIVAAPGLIDKDLAQLLIDHCRKMKYRFAVLDGKHDDTTPITDFTRGNVTGLALSTDNNFGAVYFPWIKTLNLLPKPPVGKEIIVVPPSGHICGLISRVDQANGTYYAPANEVLRGAAGLEYELTKEDQEGLNPVGVNLIRNFRGAIKIWGARTLADPAGDTGAFKYINVQRTMSQIAQSIDEGSQFVVFKPNSPRLWAQVKRVVTASLTNEWRDGALFGNTPEEAFFVKVDASNNPPEVIELGRLVIEIGVAIVQPAEFVIFRIQQFTQIPKT